MAIIEDYALIGDCETAGLVSRRGSIDWLCFPRFDSRACFAALLGTPEHGRWLLAPAGRVTSISRRYRGDTAVLETEFTTETGVVAVIDFMPVRSGFPDVVRSWLDGAARCQCGRNLSSVSTTAIERQLTHRGFVSRYETVPDVDGLPPGEASFLLCSFWLVDNLVLLGRHQDAHRLFERLLSVRNDVGLLAEGTTPAAAARPETFHRRFRTSASSIAH